MGVPVVTLAGRGAAAVGRGGVSILSLLADVRNGSRTTSNTTWQDRDRFGRVIPSRLAEVRRGLQGTAANIPTDGMRLSPGYGAGVPGGLESLVCGAEPARPLMAARLPGWRVPLYASAMAVVLSIVSPMYNEAENLPEFVRQVHAAVDSLGVEWELILVNDGSKDGSLQVAGELASANRNLRVVSFSRNFGHEAASSAGLRYAQGQAVVLIDADLQDPPAVIPAMLEKWREGYQIVYGVRSKRAGSRAEEDHELDVLSDAAAAGED